MKPGGTVAFWLVRTPSFPDHPAMNSVMTQLGRTDPRVRFRAAYDLDKVFDAMLHLPLPSSDGAPTDAWESRAEIESAPGVDVHLWGNVQRSDWSVPSSESIDKPPLIVRNLTKENLYELTRSTSAYNNYLLDEKVEMKSREDFGWQLICESWPLDSAGAELKSVHGVYAVNLTTVKRLSPGTMRA